MLETASKIKLEQLAAKARTLRLEAPLSFFLEAHLPLTTIFYHTGLLLEPAVTPLFGTERIEVFKNIFSNREQIEYLLELLNHSRAPSTSMDDALSNVSAGR